MLVRSETSGFRPYKQPSVGLPCGWVAVVAVVSGRTNNLRLGCRGLPSYKQPSVGLPFGLPSCVQTTFGWVAVAVGLPCWVAVVQPSVGLPFGLPSVDDLRCQCDHFEMGLFDLLRKRPTRAQAKLPLDAHGVGDLIEAIGDFGLE